MLERWQDGRWGFPGDSKESLAAECMSEELEGMELAPVTVLGRAAEAVGGLRL